MWVNQRALMVDPPPDHHYLLQLLGIPEHLIEGVVLTHCRAGTSCALFLFDSLFWHHLRYVAIIYPYQPFISSFLWFVRSLQTNQYHSYVYEILLFCRS